MNNWCIYFCIFCTLPFWLRWRLIELPFKKRGQCWSYRDERNQPLIHKVLILTFCQDGGSSSGNHITNIAKWQFSAWFQYPLGFFWRFRRCPGDPFFLIKKRVPRTPFQLKPKWKITIAKFCSCVMVAKEVHRIFYLWDIGTYWKWIFNKYKVMG